MKVVVATHNPGKLRELEAILAPELELVSQAALGIVEAEEPHETFVENALAKARHASRAARLPALAESYRTVQLDSVPPTDRGPTKIALQVRWFRRWPE